MNMFSILKKDEKWSEFKYPLCGWRLESRVIPLKKSGVTTSPLDRVKVVFTGY
jgi:hypothetical protein